MDEKRARCNFFCIRGLCMFIVNANLTKNWDPLHQKDEWEAKSKSMERPKVFGSVQLSNTLPVNVNKTLTKKLQQNLAYNHWR